MGASQSISSSEINSEQELKIFRQLRAEYEIFSSEGMDDAQAMARVKERYEEIVASYLPNIPKENKAEGEVKDAAYKPVPKVRFGKTELQMPIITMGCMRFQQTWKPGEDFSMKDVEEACQSNLDAILEKATAMGINHIETARAYGSSELQLGQAFKRLFEKYPRENYIIQTKVPAKEDPTEFRKVLEKSLDYLGLEQIDLVALHGVNLPNQLEWSVKEGGCLDILKEYQQKGRIRFIGFSTHADTPLIVETINTGRFDYVNLHYHFCGSYTSSGTGVENMGNLDAVKAANALDMGVFCISAADKGGMVYNPSMPLLKTCLRGNVTPLQYADLWLWNHEPAVHTLVVGAARPTDFEDHYHAAMLYEQRQEIVQAIEPLLQARETEVLGEEWVGTWWNGLFGSHNPTKINVANIVWLWNLLKAHGMYDFCRARYQALENNHKNWDTWVPGFDYDPAKASELEALLSNCPNKDKVLTCLAEAHDWLHSSKKDDPAAVAERKERGWVAAYNLQPDVPFPERKKPKVSSKEA